MILILLTLLLFTSGSVVELKSGFIGEDVLLPCICSNDPDELIWQNGNVIVNGYSKDEIIIDAFYKDRTQLFLNNEKGNCSLLLLNITLKDEGVYTCHLIVSVSPRVSKTTKLKVNLTVSEKASTHDYRNEPSREESATAVSISVPILVVAGLLAIVLLVLLLRRRHRRNNDTYVPAQNKIPEEV